MPCRRSLAALSLLSMITLAGAGRGQESSPDRGQPLRVGNVFPDMTVMAPGVGSRSETGIGALIPWADRLWAIGYVAHIRGDGIGLYEIDEDLAFRKHPASITGTFANRMVHWETEQAVIGPHLIDAEGKVRTLEGLAKHRLTATARHLEEPEKKAYFLTMEGLLFEADLETLETNRLADLREELDLPEGAQPHFKGAHTAQGRLVVANNTYEEQEYLGQRAAGRLAEWDGRTWKTLEANPYVEVAGKQNPSTGKRYGNSLYAIGWDRASVILRVLHGGEWRRYRLPKGSQAWDHTWNTEWMRIREVQTERYLMDAFGLFYELPPTVYGGTVVGIKPIASHLRICPDMVSWRGMLVLAGDQTDNAVGQPQSGLWLGHIDELWGWGKPSGWGAVWWEDDVEAGQVSDPFLMTGFDKKVVHLANDSDRAAAVSIEIDFLGSGRWREYRSIELPAGGYVHHTFPDGYSAHWVRARANDACTATVSFTYH
ncbi:hypothetical protein [Botrimarina sp.]|uniref:hypothetical protein n=1 Tax=Botrimarina sp. TaxID=2795802 RepID=UPI0032EE0EF7